MISGKNDKVITYNKAATLGQKVRNNERAFRTDDAVSVLNASSKHMTNLNPNVIKTGILPLDLYNNHSVDAIKNRKILI